MHFDVLRELCGSTSVGMQSRPSVERCSSKHSKGNLVPGMCRRTARNDWSAAEDRALPPRCMPLAGVSQHGDKTEVAMLRRARLGGHTPPDQERPLVPLLCSCRPAHIGTSPRDGRPDSGRCLSAVYGNSARPLLWECAAGHQWQTRPSSIRAGHWCPVCAHNQKLKLEVMRDLARERGGMCLSTTYQNGCTPLLWECMFGHRWRARPANVKRSLRRKGSWCPECYNARRTFRRRGSIEAVKHLAVVRKGACLSSEYHGSKVKLLWKCEFGHRWQAAPSYILQGTWCPTCARNRRLSLEQFQDIATQRGGSCLSDAYVNERTRLRWSCVKGHEWEAAPNKVKRGSWCPACARIARRSKWLLQGPRDHNEVHKIALRARGRRARLGDARPDIVVHRKV
jgi:hypothetical protein